MSLWKRGRQYWADFTVDGRRYRKRLDTTTLPVAKQRERQLIEDAGHGAVATHEQGPKRFFEAADAYIDGKAPALLAADDPVRGGAAHHAEALLRRRATHRDHAEGDRGIPAQAP